MIASHPPYTKKLQSFCELTEELAVREAAPFLARLVRDPEFLGTDILTLIQGGAGASDWYVASRFGGEDGSFSLQVFVWPPGTETRIHDHSSWGVYCCAVGIVLEERYRRLDDGSRPGHARLGKVWQLSWSAEDGASTVLPGDGGIHRVGNPYGDVAVSVHLYGPRKAEIDGRDYDPSYDRVCERLADSKKQDERKEDREAFRSKRPAGHMQNRPDCSFGWMNRNATKSVLLGNAFWEAGAGVFINRGTNGRWAETLTPDHVAEYEARAVGKRSQMRPMARYGRGGLRRG